MSFRRTNSGLSNLYLFLDCDAVVFLEGGDSLRKDQVENGLYNDLSEDIQFWQTAFSIFRPERKYQFRSIGSKETVKSIAADVMNGHTNNVIVAMDRDFDHLNGRLLLSDNIIYTRGYSWENDAWNKLALVEAFYTLSGSCKTQIDAEATIVDGYFEKCLLGLRGAVRIDAILSQYNNSLFDRDSYIRYLDIKKACMPKLNYKEVRNSLTSARKKVGKPITRKTNFTITPFIDCFGHLYAELSYRIMSYLLEKRKFPKIPKRSAWL